MKGQTTTNYAIYYAEMEDIFKQLRWVLTVRQAKLTEINLAQRPLAANNNEPERQELLRLAHHRLARSTKAASWIEAHEPITDKKIESGLGESA